MDLTSAKPKTTSLFRRPNLSNTFKNEELFTQIAVVNTKSTHPGFVKGEGRTMASARSASL